MQDFEEKCKNQLKRLEGFNAVLNDMEVDTELEDLIIQARREHRAFGCRLPWPRFYKPILTDSNNQAEIVFDYYDIELDPKFYSSFLEIATGIDVQFVYKAYEKKVDRNADTRYSIRLRVRCPLPEDDIKTLRNIGVIKTTPLSDTRREYISCDLPDSLPF